MCVCVCVSEIFLLFCGIAYSLAHSIDLFLLSHWQKEISVISSSMFLNGKLLIFIFLYHKNVFLQYLSSQFITNKMQGFYFYWKHYYSYVFTF